MKNKGRAQKQMSGKLSRFLWIVQTETLPDFQKIFRPM